MSLNLSLITEIGNLFQKLLDVTKQISQQLDNDNAQQIEGINIIVEALQLRESIINAITAKQAEWKNAGNIEPAEETEYNKRIWLCRETAKKVNEIDQKNMAGMDQVLTSFMANVKTTKDSMKVINAYHSNAVNTTERSSW